MRQLGACALVLALTSTAVAETKADALFKQGKKQLADKQYAQACTTFERVDGLDPGIGAKLNVAKCYEEWGKLAKAYRWFVDAEQMASTTSDARASKIKELAEALDGDVPRLTIKLSEGGDAASAAIKLDGKPLALEAVGAEQRVDPGPHLIEYLAGGERRTKTVPIERGGSSEVTLEVPRGTTRRTPKPSAQDELSPGAGHGRRIAGIVTASAGVVGLGVAGYLTLDARSSYRDALDAHCMAAANMCNDVGVRLTGDARSRANTATVIAIVGGAAVLGGVVLYLTAPKGRASKDHAIYVTPVIGSEGGAVVLGGGF